MVKYILISTGDSSNRYGNCEICGKHCSEVFMQYPIEKKVIRGKEIFIRGKTIFGHKDCLIKARKEVAK